MGEVSFIHAGADEIGRFRVQCVSAERLLFTFLLELKTKSLDVMMACNFCKCDFFLIEKDGVEKSYCVGCGKLEPASYSFLLELSMGPNRAFSRPASEPHEINALENWFENAGVDVLSSTLFARELVAWCIDYRECLITPGEELSSSYMAS